MNRTDFIKHFRNLSKTETGKNIEGLSKLSKQFKYVDSFFIGYRVFPKHFVRYFVIFKRVFPNLKTFSASFIVFWNAFKPSNNRQVLIQPNIGALKTIKGTRTQSSEWEARMLPLGIPSGLTLFPHFDFFISGFYITYNFYHTVLYKSLMRWLE